MYSAEKSSIAPLGAGMPFTVLGKSAANRSRSSRRTSSDSKNSRSRLSIARDWIIPPVSQREIVSLATPSWSASSC